MVYNRIGTIACLLFVQAVIVSASLSWAQQCEQTLTCDDILLIYIAKSESEKDNGNKEIAYVAVVLLDGRRTDFVPNNKRCIDSPFLIRSENGFMMTRQPGMAYQQPWFTFSDRSLNVVSDKARQLCAEKFDEKLYYWVQ